MISMAATSYQAINYGSTSISPYYVYTGDSWSVTNYMGYDRRKRRIDL